MAEGGSERDENADDNCCAHNGQFIFTGSAVPKDKDKGRNGEYGLIEIKIGGKDNIDRGAETLKSLAAKIDTDKMKRPSFLMVLTGIGQFAYTRPDGVFVVPIGCLKD